MPNPLADLKILNELFTARNGLDMVTLFRRQRISFSAFSESCRRLERLELITFSDHLYEITNAGMSELLAKRHRIMQMEDKSWRKIPDEFKTETIADDKIYIPRRSRLDRCFFD